jgi:hypothetical protein
VLQKRFNESRRRHRLSVATTRHPYESIISLARDSRGLLPDEGGLISRFFEIEKRTFFNDKFDTADIRRGIDHYFEKSNCDFLGRILSE